MTQTSNRLPVLAAQIKLSHAGVRSAAQLAASHAIEAGQALIEAKALLKHGQWLPWLKEHVGFSERTAQLYMKIVALGFNSATVADIGLQNAARALSVIDDDGYDPFYGSTETEIREWLLYGLFLNRECGMEINAAMDKIEWLLQGKNTFPLAAWLGAPGAQLRRSWWYRYPDFSDRFLEQWALFLRTNNGRARADIEADIQQARSISL